MTKKIEAFGCWSNERHIVVGKYDAGVIHSMLFTTKEAAEEYYRKPSSYVMPDDPIVKVTVEIIEDKDD